MLGVNSCMGFWFIWISGRGADCIDSVSKASAYAADLNINMAKNCLTASYIFVHVILILWRAKAYLELAWIDTL